MNAELRKILDRQTGTDQKLSSLSNEVGQVLDRAISKTREVELEAREQTLREAILNIIDREKSPFGIDAETIVSKLEEIGFTFVATLEELRKMQEEDILEFSKKLLSADTKIKRRSLE